MKKILLTLLVMVALTGIVSAEGAEGGIVLPQIPVTSVDTGGRLIFSDSPEYVKEDGILYADTVQGEARVLYYHLNDSPTNKKFAVILENIDGKTVGITVKRRGDGTPNAENYLVLGKETQTSYYARHIPLSMELEPGEKCLLSERMDSRVVKPQELVYGVYDFFAGGRIKVTVLAYPTNANPYKFMVNAPILPADEMHLRGTFDNMTRIITAKRPLNLNAAHGAGACLILADDDGDKYRRGVDALDGTVAVNQGNYGIDYWLDIPVQGAGKSKYILTPLGGSYAGAMRVHSRQKRSRLTQTPEGQIWFGDVPLSEADENKQAELLRQGKGIYFPHGEQTLLGEFNNNDRVLFEFSPPGASNLPVNFIILSVPEEKQSVRRPHFFDRTFAPRQPR